MNKRFKKGKDDNSDFALLVKLIWWKRPVEARESRIVTEGEHTIYSDALINSYK